MTFSSEIAFCVLCERFHVNRTYPHSSEQMHQLEAWAGRGYINTRGDFSDAWIRNKNVPVWSILSPNFKCQEYFVPDYS